jgi:hypothetical protein
MAKTVKKTKKPAAKKAKLDRTYRLDLICFAESPKGEMRTLTIERRYWVADIKRVRDMLSCMDEELGFIRKLYEKE